MPDKLDAAPPPAAASDPQGQVAAAAAPEPVTEEERGVLAALRRWVGGTSAAAPQSAVPAASAPSSGSSEVAALKELVEALNVRTQEQAVTVERLTAQAAAADHEALVARVKACAGLPAALVDGQVTAVEAMRAAGQHEAAEKLLAGLEAAAPPPRFAPGAFGDLGVPADVGVRMGDPVPESCSIDRDEEAKVAAIMAEHKDDPEAARQALLELAREVR